jgi:hypothetical protein
MIKPVAGKVGMKKSRKIALTLIASACLMASGCGDDEQKTEKQIYASKEACEKDWDSKDCAYQQDDRRYHGPHYYFIGGRPWYYPHGYNNPVETRPGQGAYNLKPGDTSAGAVSRISSSRSSSSSRGGFGSSSHSHGVGS